MDARIGWGLAAAALLAGWFGYGWRGLVLAASVIVFWLLLQFSRALRVLRAAGRRPVGHVDSAVMFNAKLQQGMRLIDVVRLTGSLGRKVSHEPETFAWTDTGGAQVYVDFVDGRCDRWRLTRPTSG